MAPIQAAQAQMTPAQALATFSAFRKEADPQVARRRAMAQTMADYSGPTTSGSVAEGLIRMAQAAMAARANRDYAMEDMQTKADAYNTKQSEFDRGVAEKAATAAQQGADAAPYTVRGMNKPQPMEVGGRVVDAANNYRELYAPEPNQDELDLKRESLDLRRQQIAQTAALAGSRGGSTGTRPMTAEEKAQWGYPAGAIVGIDERTGKPVVPSGAGKTMTAEKAMSALNSATSKAGFVKAAIADARRLAQTKQVDFGPVQIGTTGIGSLGAVIPGSPASDLQSQIETVVANIGFNELAQMRAQSPTGAALGSVTEKELKFLQSVIASLSASQSQAQFLKNLDRVEQAYDRVLQSLQNDYARDFGGGAQPAPRGAVAPGDYVWNPATGRMEPAQ